MSRFYISIYALRGWGLIPALVAFCILPYDLGHAAGLLAVDQRRTVVLDPGHGGADAGAAGVKGTLEKTIAFDIAGLLTGHLEKKYRVVLTRTGDYDMDLYQRTEIANHERADVFISLHTGGSFVIQKEGMSVFYYHRQPALPGSSGQERQNGSVGGAEPVAWQDIQLQHQKESIVLAGLVQSNFNKMGVDPPCTLKQAPLEVLKGADMPAVAIEIGYLTHPAEAARLDNPSELDRIARAIERAVDQFLNKKGRKVPE